MNVSTNHQRIPDTDFRVLGMRDVAYVRPASIGEGEAVHMVYAIHAADGTAVGAAESRELALAAIRQNGLEAVSVH